MRKYMKISKILLIMLILLLSFDFSVARAQLNPPSLTAAAASSSQIDLSWTDPNKGEAGYQIERSLSPTSGFNVIAAVGKNVTSYKDNGLSSGTKYYYKVKVYKRKESVYSNTANATTLAPDTTPPSVPTGLNASAPSCSQINLSWSASTDNVGVVGYKVYRNGSYLKPVTGTSTSDTGLSGSTQYCYRVSAYDAAGNESAQGSQTCATTPACADTILPTVSITSPPNNTTYTTPQTVTITASASDNVGVTKVEFYQGSTLKGTDTTNAYTYSWIFTASDNGTHSWIAKAYDAAGNVGTSSTVNLTVNISTPDTTPPSVPANLSAAAASCSQINLSWNASTDNVGVTGYKVYRNGAYLKSVTGTSNPDTGLSASTQYCYKVSAYDAAGNESGLSNQACASTPSCVPVSGEPIWSKRFGSSGKDRGWAVAVDHQGNVIVTGEFAYTVDFGGGSLAASSPYGPTSIFVAKYSPSGSYIWSKSFEVGTMADNMSYGIAVDSHDNIIITGTFVEKVDFGGGRLYGYASVIPDIFVAKLSPTGDHIWSKIFGSVNEDYGLGVAVDDNDNVLVTGAFTGMIDFGGGPLTSAGGMDAFVVKFSSTGSHLWSKRFGSTSGDAGNSIAVDGSGNVVVAGYFQGTVDFGGGPLASAGSKDIFMVKFSSTGSHLWSESFGDTSDQEAVAITVDGNSNVIVTGSFRGTVDFGGVPLSTSTFYPDIFVTKFSPAGSHLWSESFGDPDNETERITAVAVNGSGNAVVTGYFSGTMDFGVGPLTSAGSYDIFLLKLEP